MFWKKKEIDNRITNIEKQLADIRFPYLFEVGQNVLFYNGPTYYDMPIETSKEQNYIEGKIVDKKFSYKNINDITYLNYCNYHAVTKYVLKRENVYQIYDDKLNCSFWKNEYELKNKLNTKKK